MANDIYNYKRYQLSLNINDEMQKSIIDYLDSFKAGKQRNNALVKLLLNAMNGTDDVNIPSQASDMLTEIRLNKLENMIRSLVASYNNVSVATQHGPKASADVPCEENTKKSLLEDNQVPGQMLFDSVDMEIKDENTVSTVGSNVAEGELVPTKEDSTENGVIKEVVANNLNMPFPSTNVEATEGINDDNFDNIIIDDDVMDFMKALNGDI